MARIFTSGFEHQSIPTAKRSEGTEHWNWYQGVANTTIAVSTTYKHGGSASARAYSESPVYSSIWAGWGSSVTDAYMSIWFRADALPSSGTHNVIDIVLDDSGLYSPILMRLSSTGVLGAFYNKTGVTNFNQIGSTYTISTGVWYHIEMHGKVNSNTSFEGEWKLNGISMGSYADTGITGNAGTTMASTEIGLEIDSSTTGSGDYYFDDIIVNDTSGSYENTWVGDQEVICLRPDGDGGNYDWLKSGGGAGSNTNYQDEDETPYPDDATSYLRSTTQNATDLYTMANSGLTASDTITAVEVGLRYKRYDPSGTPPTITTIAKTSALATKTGSNCTVDFSADWRTNSNTAPSYTSTHQYRPYPLQMYLQSDDSTAWTASALDDTKIGIKVTGASGTKYASVTQPWAMVSYKRPSPSVYDSSAVTESVTVRIVNHVSVYDSSAVTDVPTMRLGANNISVYDSTAVTDEPTVTVESPVTEYNVSVYDETTVTDESTVFLDHFDISVYEESTVTDEVETKIPTLHISVYDETTVTDEIVVGKDSENISVYDETTVTDEITVEKDSENIEVYEESAVTDAVEVALDHYEIDVYDETTVTEDVNLLITELFIDVYDESEVTDAVEMSGELNIEVYDETTVTDDSTVRAVLNISVYDETAVTDVVTMGGSNNISVYDSSAVTDVPTVGTVLSVYVLEGKSSPGWYNASWLYRSKVTVLASKVDADDANYQVYVRLSDLPSGFHAHCNQTDARDIRVTTSDGQTELAREVVFYDAATDTGEIHFLASVDSDTDTDFFIYYGNDAASDYAHTDTYGTHAVWADYEGVWHLQSNTAAYDSSPNSYDLAKVNTPLTASARVGDGVDLQSVDKDKFTLVGTSCPNIFMSTDQTWQYIVKGGASGSPLMRARTDAQFQAGMWHAVNTTNVRYNMIGMVFQGTANFYGDATIDNIGTAFRNIAMVLDISTDVRIYCDGVLKKTDPVTSGTPDTTKTNISLSIGGLGGYDSYYHTGIVDEARIRGGLLTLERLSTEYNNQNSPSTFYTIGGEETNTLVVTDAVEVKTILNISVYDQTTVTDESTLSPVLNIEVYDETAVTDEPTVEIVSGEPTELNVSVYDDIAVTDAVEVGKDSENVFVYDSTTVTDVVTVGKDSENVFVYDDTAVTDEPTVEVIGGIELSVYDETTVTDAVVVEKDSENVFVYDQTTVTDVPTVGKDSENISVYDQTTVTDAVVVSIPILHVFVYDDTAVTDEPTVIITEGAYNISVYEESTITDAVLVELDSVNVNVYETTTVTDVVTVGKDSENIEVYDSTAVTDVVTVTTFSSYLEVYVYDEITVTDVPTVEVDLFSVEVYDETTVTDEAVVVIIEAGSLDISVYDETTVTDVPTLSFDSYNVSVYDATTVTDVVTVSRFSNALEISVYDRIGTTPVFIFVNGRVAMLVIDGGAEDFASFYVFV